MDGIHDMGGMQGFGPVEPERDEPAFHERWEGRVHGMAMTLWASNTDIGSLRTQIEQMGTVPYLTTSYYEHWLHGLEQNLIARGRVTAAELDAAARALAAGAEVPATRDPDLAARAASLLEPEGPAPAAGDSHRFTVGDRVRVRRISTTGHNRCPRYVRGAAGRIERLLAPAELPEEGDASSGEEGPGYTVAFAASELWPDDGSHHTVLVDLWEEYLEQ